MALGSSAPEIMLAVLDTVQTLGQIPGELGPSTIVGSAAFNLFIISAVCVCALPEGETKKIEQMGVFAVTATSSILAYVWMVVVLYDENISIAEALITFLMFPGLLGVAYAADKGLCQCGAAKGTKVLPEEDNARLLEMAFENHDGTFLANKDSIASMLKEEMAKKGKSAEEVAQDLLEKTEKNQTVSANHYRINAMKSLSGQRRALPKMGEAEKSR
jgi:solute carrier family 8 (sodium/calcium exchanger)